MLAPSSPDRLIALRGGIGAVPGIKLTGLHAGFKKRKPDLALIVADRDCVAAACVTTNEIKAAPVLVSNEHLAEDGEAVRAIVCNSGCANACTGERGMHDARTTARQTGALLGLRPTQVLVASTGVIGVPLAMDRMQKGLERIVGQLGEGSEAAYEAAEAIMTTDHVPKLSAYAFYHQGKRYVVGGIAKGAGMIAPNMATMLAFVATDAPMSKAALHGALVDAVGDTFNMISVDGDMSTNDSIYALAPRGEGEAPAGFAAALRAVCEELAVAMVRDGEGATKTMTVTVAGAKAREQARTICKAIINSSLVKCALYGEDPNWGRIIAAAGSVGAGVVEGLWSLRLNDKVWVHRGAVEALSEAEAHAELEGQDVRILLDLGQGEEQAVGWGCDLTTQYVHINAHYRT
ncbi:MAG TPA: bifunctional glutamate N-acetyltransferase/amino-acid acetyltransferase ArgJ [Candidatus Dormibacteraeota bacterium]|nr:bifunctional glutamate N-acetyltransferase/amino-acid acetyltransferase ArgJ [Candidatus Dormibacteraeota bacterium]